MQMCGMGADVRCMCCVGVCAAGALARLPHAWVWHWNGLCAGQGRLRRVRLRHLAVWLLYRSMHVPGQVCVFCAGDVTWAA